MYGEIEYRGGPGGNFRVTFASADELIITIGYLRDSSYDSNFQTGRYSGPPIATASAFKREWVGKTAWKGCFRPLNRYISETVENRHIITMEN